MIISCINCNKKFYLNSDLIPESGRLLVCGICNHEWFYKKEVIPSIIQSDNNDNPSFESDEKLVTEKDQGELELFNKTLNPKIVDKKKDNNNYKKTIDAPENQKNEVKSIDKEEKKFIFLKIVFVFIISFTGFIILIDTFKYQISKILPNIELILYNLYETIKDIKLFFIDLI